MSNPVFYATPQQLAGLGSGALFSLDGAEGRHATTVKRLEPGEPVDMCDGAGLRLVCTVANAGKGVLTVRVETVRQEPVPAISFTLVQALAKGDRDELAIETATELGIDVVEAVPDPREATVPQVSSLAGTAQLCELIAGAALALILHEDATDSVADVARGWFSAQLGAPDRATAGPPTGNIVMIVGPEGGMSTAEVQAFVAAGARTALLGHHVLRSSTAGPAAVVLLSQELGRW